MKRWERGRLVWYRRTADTAWWDRHWRERLDRPFYAPYERGHLGPFEGAFSRHMPRRGRILEAGCGPGQYVGALRARGCEAEGVEWGAETVAGARALFPGLPVEQGDVTRLRAPDGHYAAYISLGVMEHRAECPEPFLAEARRVLGAGGVAFISVPFVHRPRALKARLGLYCGRVGDLEFYQYAFRKEEFRALLAAHGLCVVEQIPYDGAGGLADEVPGLRRLLEHASAGRRWAARLARAPWCDRLFGHMLLFVCRVGPGAGAPGAGSNGGGEGGPPP